MIAPRAPFGLPKPARLIVTNIIKKTWNKKRTWKWAQNSIPSPTGQKGHLDMGGLLLKTIAFVENYY